jgi:hypothetical protein
MEEYLSSQASSAKWLMKSYCRKNIARHTPVIELWMQNIPIVDDLCADEWRGYNIYLSLHTALLVNSHTAIDIYYIPSLLTYLTTPQDGNFYAPKYLSDKNIQCQYVFIPDEHKDEIPLTYNNDDDSVKRFISLSEHVNLKCETPASKIQRIPLLIVFKARKPAEHISVHNIKEFMTSINTNVGSRIGRPTLLRSEFNINGTCVSYLLIDAS